MNRLRKCGIYTQWSFTQPQRRMKFCHLQVNGLNGGHHLMTVKAKSRMFSFIGMEKMLTIPGCKDLQQMQQ
jgi:hypothetical protein